MSGQARHGGGVEQIGAVLDVPAQAIRSLPDIHCDVEDGHAAIEVDRRRAVRRSRGAAIELRREELETHLEKRIAAEIALGLQFLDQFFERQLLVRVAVKRHFPHPRQQRAEAGIAGKVGAQHQGVDEEADQLFELGTITACDVGADDDVVLAGVALQQHGKRGEKRHEQGRAFALAERAQRVGQRARQHDFLERPAIAQHRRPRPVGRQLQRQHAGQLLLPV